ncbi:hypothetical protein BDZ90DRAFT_268033 [Jaminaea rosea]|uniref:Uncharacterized protein n=1 Tax=Jaminaea rosea TaxID=1569628 RepID=A0A316UK82_9BASI|nr:hypothetical protein BDZ90DRAFT_268033 [Jaminaea rosea]PWN25639.1 hypothetical protein BDZ90DRAFT_268033 [Jaminaea rosea]
MSSLSTPPLPQNFADIMAAITRPEGESPSSIPSPPSSLRQPTPTSEVYPFSTWVRDQAISQERRAAFPIPPRSASPLRSAEEARNVGQPRFDEPGRGPLHRVAARYNPYSHRNRSSLYHASSSMELDEDRAAYWKGYAEGARTASDGIPVAYVGSRLRLARDMRQVLQEHLDEARLEVEALRVQNATLSGEREELAWKNGELEEQLEEVRKQRDQAETWGLANQQALLAEGREHTRLQTERFATYEELQSVQEERDEALVKISGLEEQNKELQQDDEALWDFFEKSTKLFRETTGVIFSRGSPGHGNGQTTMGCHDEEADMYDACD